MAQEKLAVLALFALVCSNALAAPKAAVAGNKVSVLEPAGDSTGSASAPGEVKGQVRAGSELQETSDSFGLGYYNLPYHHAHGPIVKVPYYYPQHVYEYYYPGFLHSYRHHGFGGYGEYDYNLGINHHH